MMKKITSVFLALIMCLTLSVPALALEQASNESTPNIQVVNRSNCITAQAINEIANDISASLTNDDGTVTPLDMVVTIEDVSSPSSRSVNGDAATYQVRADSKIESDSDNKNDQGVTASISVTLRWTDVPGTKNIIESVNGSITVDKGTLTKAWSVYGDLDGSPQETEDLGTKKSFSRQLGWEVGTPHCEYHANFKDASFELNVFVTPSIFD